LSKGFSVVEHIMKVTVLLFASAREIIGESSIDVVLGESGSERDSVATGSGAGASIPGTMMATAQSLLDTICSQYPALGSSRSSLSLAVNRKYVRGSDPFQISENDEIALIPPISGG
jgi:molybdopterin converting factor small subunit